MELITREKLQVNDLIAIVGTINIIATVESFTDLYLAFRDNAGLMIRRPFVQLGILPLTSGAKSIDQAYFITTDEVASVEAGFRRKQAGTPPFVVTMTRSPSNGGYSFGFLEF